MALADAGTSSAAPSACATLKGKLEGQTGTCGTGDEAVAKYEATYKGKTPGCTLEDVTRLKEADDACNAPQTTNSGGSPHTDPPITKEAFLATIQDWADEARNKEVIENERRQRCHFDNDTDTIRVVVGPTGALLCSPGAIPEGSKVEVQAVISPSWKKLYKIAVKRGEARKDDGFIRGSVTDAVKLTTPDAKSREAPPTFAEAKLTPFGIFGPFEEVSNVKVIVSVDAAAIGEEHQITVKRAYPLNVGVGFTMSLAYEEYKVANNHVVASTNRHPEDVFVTLQLNLGVRDVSGTTRWGNYYDNSLDCDDAFNCAATRVSAVLGVSATDPLEKLYVGGSVRLWGSLSLTMGGLYRYEPLLGDFAKGQEVATGTTLPTSSKRNWTFAAGLVADVGAAKPLVDLLLRK